MLDEEIIQWTIEIMGEYVFLCWSVEGDPTLTGTTQIIISIFFYDVLRCSWVSPT